MEPHHNLQLAKALLIAELKEGNDDAEDDRQWSGDGQDTRKRVDNH